VSDDSSDKTSLAAQHEVFTRADFKVAPTDGSTKFNAIRIPLIPVACWKLNDPAFAFDSSFVSPNFKGEIVPTPGSDSAASTGSTAASATASMVDAPLTTVSKIIATNQGCPAAVFGHCDPAGSDALNKTLGDRRAIAIYALLTRQPDLWAYLYDNAQVGDQWDLRMVQTMLAGVPDASGTPYYAGDANGTRDAATTDAVRRFQADAGLSTSGEPESQTRNALFGAYMDWLCTPPSPSATLAPLLQPTDFLGGQSAGRGDLPKMSLQSCGKFNPIVLLTKEEMGGEDTTDGASKVQRNADDAPNRRVIVFFFEKGTAVDPSYWPCPKVKESNAKCNDAFWPDGDTRRQNGDTLRLYKVTRDTMACRWYDRFARRSPCEGAERIKFRVRLCDYGKHPLPRAPFHLVQGGASWDGLADEGAFVTVVVSKQPDKLRLEWGRPGSSGDAARCFGREYWVDVGGNNDEGDTKRLYNLGYVKASVSDNVEDYQRDFKHEVTGRLDDIRDELRKFHDGGPRPGAAES
jgi:hypothetical protein